MSDSDTRQTRLTSTDDPEAHAADASTIDEQPPDRPLALVDDLPTVQLPLGRDHPGLTVDGEFYTLIELPEAAADAYRQYAEQGGDVRIHQCDRCGYLTDADAFSATSYNQAYECSACGARLIGTAQHGAQESYTQVVGPMIDPDNDRYLDVEAVVPDTQCPNDHGPTIEEKEYETARGHTRTSTEVNEAAVACPECVPNHPSHLGRLQNAVAGSLSMDEMLHTAAVAVQVFREA